MLRSQVTEPETAVRPMAYWARMAVTEGAPFRGALRQTFRFDAEMIAAAYRPHHAKPQFPPSHSDLISKGETFYGENNKYRRAESATDGDK